MPDIIMSNISINDIKQYIPRFQLNDYIRLKNKKFYKKIDSNEQINAILKNSDVSLFYKFCELIAKYIRKDNYRDDVYNLLKQNNRDTYFYAKMRKLRRKFKGTNIDRERMHADMYYNHLKKAIPNLKIKNYLDIGCGDCIKTQLLGQKLGLSDKNIYGADLKTWFGYEHKEKLNINLITIKNDGKLPFKDKQFDLISAFMVLHHVDKLDILLKEINRCLQPGGYFIIREHDAVNDLDYMMIDVEHAINELVIPDKVNEKFYKEYYGVYHDWVEWRVIMNRHGLRQIEMGYDSLSVRFNVAPTRYFYAIFKKV